MTIHPAWIIVLILTAIIRNFEYAFMEEGGHENKVAWSLQMQLGDDQANE